MALHAIPHILPFDYVPNCDKNEPEKTTFKLRPLNGQQHMEVLHEIDETGHYTARAMGLAIKYGLIGWENFTDAGGAALPFSPLNITRIPPVIMQELALAVIRRSDLGEAALKN